MELRPAMTLSSCGAELLYVDETHALSRQGTGLCVVDLLQPQRMVRVPGRSSRGVSAVAAHARTGSVAFAPRAAAPAVYLLLYPAVAERDQRAFEGAGVVLEFSLLAFSHAADRLCAVAAIERKVVVWAVASAAVVAKCDLFSEAPFSLSFASFDPSNADVLAVCGRLGVAFLRTKRSKLGTALDFCKAAAPAVAATEATDDDDDDDDDDDCAAAPPSTAAAVDAAHVLATCWDVGVLFVANALGTIVEYNASDGTISRTFSMPDLKLAACTALMLFPDHVLATYSDATMRWVGKHRLDSVEATISLPQEAHVPMARMPKFKHISACAASPAYDQLLLGTAGGTMYTVDLSGTFELAPRELPPPRRISDLHAAPVTALAAVHVAGEALLVTAGLDGLLEVWQLPAGNLRGRHLFWAAPAAAADALRPASLDAAAKKDDESDSGQEIAITSLAAAHSDALLAVGLVTGGVSLVHCGLAARAAHGSMLDMVELAEVQLFHGAATAVAFDVGLLLAVGCCEEKGVFIIDCSASARNPFSVVANADVDCGGIAALTWHAPDELLVATDGGGVACFSVPAAAPSTSMTLTWACAAVHAGPVTTLLALPAGKVACLTPAATQLAVVNVSQQESCGKTAVKTSSAQHASGLLCMAVSLARDVVATGDGAGGVVLWAVGADGALAEVASREPALQGLHAGEVLAVAFCGGGVASAGVDGAVFVSEFDVAEKAVSPEEASAAATARDAPPPHYALVERARHATARPVVVGAPTFSEALALKAAATNSLDIQAQKSVRSNMVSDLRSRLGELLAKNERAPALEKLDRDEFVLDVAGRDRILEANVLRAKDAISKLDAEDAVRDACAEKIRQDCWASMDVHATEIHALNRDRPCVANFPLVKRSAKVLGQLRKVRDLRKLELRDISRGGKACVVWPVEAAVEAAVPADVDWILNHGVLKPFESAQAAKDSVRDGEYGDEDGDVVAEAVLNFEDVGTQMYPPTSVVTPSQKRFQALVAAQVARELQAQFNARFVKLQKEKSDEADKLEERNVVIRGILDEFKSDEPWPAPHFDRAAELPESLLTVLDDEVGVDDADTNAAPAAVVKKKADGDDGALRALEDMMHGTLNVPGEADLLELEIVAPEWLEGLGDAEMNEDQKKSFHVYEAATKLRAEEREKRRKARELELKKLRTEVSDLTKSFDEKVRALDKDRVEAMAAVVAQELYGLRLAAALVDQEDMAATGKRLVVKDSKLRVLVADHEALLAELYEAVDSNAASLDALQAEDRLLERNFLKDFGAALDADAQRAAAVLYKFRDSDSRAGRNAKEISKDPFHATVAEAGGDWTRTDDAAKLDDAALQGVKELRLRKVRKETDIADALASLKASSAEQHVAAAVVAQLRNDVLDVAAERRALAESVNLSNRNCEILVRLKQGQDEVEQEAVVTDYGDAVLIPAALVHTVNLEIRRLGLEQVKVLSKIKNFRKSINYLQWEDEFGLLKATDLEEYHTDLQLMHVTKGLQAVLQGDPAQREREHALKVEKRVKLMDSVHAEACTKLHRANAKLAHRTRERSDENNRLRAQLRELELSVSAREGVFRGSGAGGDGTARAAAAAADMKRVVLRRRLLDLARLQSEECDFLRQELDRLRQRTFPSFAYATRDRNAGD
ncbi:hypothetical protein M885DRAFT_590664 [Pelagophyceae sp. CCMP2097]|nr:hypothetical protein M885DRAFT_590664 [Pelagophyceae sp. CCMP2097]